MAKRRIIIIGGGFAGADLARSLRGKLPHGWEVVLFSRENHFVFTPLLAEVVGSAIDPRHVVWAIREMTPGTVCRTVAVHNLDLERREVIYKDSVGGEVREGWDHLVLACGLDVNLDMIPGMAQHAWPVKRLGDALALRNHVIQQLERAEAEPDAERRAQLLSFAVVGGGFTGIELAGSIMDLLADAPRFYQRFQRDALRVTVVEGAPRILATLPEPLSDYAARDLRARGVTLLTSQHVKEVRADGIALGDGSTVAANTVITAVGNKTQALLDGTSLPKERGRLVVSGAMQVDGREDIWALGDCAAVPNAFDNSVSPTLGQFSIRQATQLAENLIAVISGKPPRPFHYHMKGMFAAIGHNRAVGNPFGLRITGFPAYIMWRAIYWTKMPSVARRLQIAFDWTWDLIFPRDIVEISTLRTGRPVEDSEATRGA